jgi:peptidoglycan/xylan/chitin deacetylase (PgdA/CDA1 family)
VERQGTAGTSDTCELRRPIRAATNTTDHHRQTDMPRGIVVFTGNLSHSVRKNIVEIDKAVPDLRWLIVHHTPPRTPAQLLRNQWRNLRRNGWRWIPYQLNDLWQRWRTNGAAPALGNCGDEYTTDALTARDNVELLHVQDIHAAASLQAVMHFAPQLGLSLAAPILRASLFRIPTQGTLNLHKGKVPDYRGMPPAFWELWNDESSVGCTVHWVDEKLDTGDIAAQTTIDREPYSTLRGLQLRLDEVGVALMKDVVVRQLAGDLLRSPQPAGGKTYRKPRLAEVAALERKIAQRAPAPALSARGVLKREVGRAAFTLWRAGLRHTLAPRITVLLYHRVSDSARDNLTVGIEQFDRQMALLRQHCEPLSIEQVIGSHRVGRSRKPLVCVTFDDGYLDNYEHAAPILLKHQVPAAFFVSTGIVGTDRRFPHDVRRGNPPIPVMQWDQLRAMKGSGFTIGSHSVSHIDCAGEPEAQVWSELTLSRDDLRRELGLDDVIFGYPYGGRQHMTAQRLELVKRAGYSACLSAYGGSNIGAVDRFDVKRLGIHWRFSDQDLLFACLGLR